MWGTQLLSGLTKDADPEVRKVVCGSLVSLLDRAGEHMLPNLRPLTEFFLETCATDPNPEVVLAACEYWSTLAEAAAFEDDDVKEYYISLFPRYGPGLWLSCWVLLVRADPPSCVRTVMRLVCAVLVARVAALCPYSSVGCGTWRTSLLTCRTTTLPTKEYRTALKTCVRSCTR